MVSGIYLLVEFAVETFAHWRQELLVHYVIEEKDLGMAWLMGSLTCLLFCILGAFLVWIEPAASGSGIAEVIMYLNGLQLRKQHSWRSLICKVLSLVCLVSSGLFSGVDGPMTHIGLIVAILMIELVSKNESLARMFYGDQNRPDIDSKDDERMILNAIHRRAARLFTASGAAAGIAAAFHAPMGGVIFALEEAISFFSPALIIRTCFTTTLVYFLIGFIGHYKEIQTYILSTEYALFPKSASCLNPIAFEDIFWFSLLGVIAGLAGALYNYFVTVILSVKLRLFNTKPHWRIIELIFICLLTVAVVVVVPLIFGNNCTPMTQVFQHLEKELESCRVDCRSNLTDYLTLDKPECFSNVCILNDARLLYTKQFFGTISIANNACLTRKNYTSSVVDIHNLAKSYAIGSSFVVDGDNNCYYQLPSLLFVSPKKILSNLLMRGTYEIFDPGVLAVYAVFYMTVSVLTYNVMLPSDSVIPNLIFGAAWGRMMGILVNRIKESTGAPLIDPGSYALIGASAFWSGTSRIVLTIVVISAEATLDLSNLLGVIVAVFTATTVGNWFNKGLFHEEIRLRNYPFLPFNCPSNLRGKRVMDIMSSDLVILYETETVGEIFRKLGSCSHQGFPVVSAMSVDSLSGSRKWKLLGMIARIHLRDKLKVTVQISPEDDHIIEGTLSMEKAQEALKALKHAQALQMNVSVEVSDFQGDSVVYQSALAQNSTVVDLTKIMFTPAHTIHLEMSSQKAYTMFRNLGLRTLCVVDDDFCIVGVVTRKDFVDLGDKEWAQSIPSPGSPKVHQN